MEIKIQSIHFDATEKLQAFIEKKIAKLEKTYEDIQKVEVQLKVVKPATALNKEVHLDVAYPANPPTHSLSRIAAEVFLFSALGLDKQDHFPHNASTRQNDKKSSKHSTFYRLK